MHSKRRLHFQYPVFWVISPFLFLFLKLKPVRRFGFLLRAFLEYNSSLERHYQASQHLKHVPYIISRRISAKVCSKGNGREVPFVKFNSMKKVILQTRKFTFQIIFLTTCRWMHILPSYIAFLYHSNALCMEMYIKPLAGCPSWTQTLEWTNSLSFLPIRGKHWTSCVTEGLFKLSLNFYYNDCLICVHFYALTHQHYFSGNNFNKGM